LLTTTKDEKKLKTIFNLLEKSCNYFISKYQKRFYEMYKRKDYIEIVEKLYATERKKELNKLIKDKSVSDEDKEIYKKELNKLKSKTLTEDEKKKLWNELHKIQDIYRLRGTYPDFAKGDRANQNLIKKQNEYIQQNHKFISGDWLRSCIDGVWTGIQKKTLNPKIRLHYKNNVNFLSSFSGRAGTGNYKGEMMGGIKFNKETHEVTIGIGEEALKIKAVVKNKKYEIDCLSDPNQIRFGKIVRKKINNHFKYYIQLTMEGKIPEKESVQMGKGRVGIDIGTQTMASVSDNSVELIELCKDIDKQEQKIIKLQRALDRSRRKNNPHFYNKRGEIIPITEYNKQKFLDKKLIRLTKYNKPIRLWKESKNYKVLKNQIAEIKRHQAAVRKTKHIELANSELRKGNKFYVEDMKFAALSKKAKETTTNEKTGKINKKKRFGKSIANKAPKMFLTILENKVNSKGGTYKKVDTFEYKASQYNHFTHDYEKKALSKRWNYFNNGDVIQRDLYSAFLIQNPNDDLKHPDDEQIIQKYPNFKMLHDQTMERLKNTKQLKSMGV